eukprot:scaffold84044_cov28-Prasinocladus_malaysianus.AAC.1
MVVRMQTSGLGRSDGCYYLCLFTGVRPGGEPGGGQAAGAGRLRGPRGHLRGSPPRAKAGPAAALPQLQAKEARAAFLTKGPSPMHHHRLIAHCLLGFFCEHRVRG